MLVVAPLSANTLAKVALGMSDNLLTCVVRAWDWTNRPLIVSRTAVGASARGGETWAAAARRSREQSGW